MSGREVRRRILLWGIVAVCLAASICLAVLGEWRALIGFFAFPIVGAIILTSRPGNGVGWYLLAVGIFAPAIMWGLDPEITLLAPAWAEALVGAGATAFWTSIFLVAAIYPTGRAETRLGRAALWIIAGLAAAGFLGTLFAPLFTSGRPNPFAPPGVTELLNDVFPVIFQPALPATVALIVVDLVLRWRRASLIARLQYRWFVFAIAGILVISVISAIATAFAPGEVARTLNDVVGTVSLNLIPVSIGIAITRHGLYEINRVVSRTVSYTVVTAVAVGVYAIVVTSITWLAPELPSVGVAVATLAGAAVFLPALRWAQRIIDRRFDRERYDAQRVVDAFGERLRSQVDPAATAADLIVAVERTLQPTSVGIWAGVRR